MIHAKQWKVTWFPDHTAQVTMEYHTELAARARFEDEVARGHNPILESRIIPEAPPWQIVENSAVRP